MSQYLKEQHLAQVSAEKSNDLDGVATLKQSLLEPAPLPQTPQGAVADQLIAERDEREGTAYVRDRDLDSTSGRLLQFAANAEFGARRLVSYAAVTPNTLAATGQLNDVDDRARDLFAQSRQRELTEEENTYLDTIPENTQLNRITGLPRSDAQTRRQLLESASTNLDQANEIRDVFENQDRNRLVNPVSKQRLIRDLSASYEANSEYFSRSEAAMISGDFSTTVAEGLRGIARLVVAGGGDILSNPQATFEFIAEQAPQLALGATSRSVLGATNLSYGLAIYEDSLNNYREENDGALPNKAEASEMLAFSLSASVAEQIGDAAILSQFRQVPGIRQSLESAARAPRAARRAVNNPITRTLGATASGVAREAGTEVYQTAVEENLSRLNRDFDGAALFTAGVLGGAAGGFLSGAGRATSELRARGQVGEQQRQRTDNDSRTTELQIDAIETGNVAPLLNPENPSEYNPAKAAMALAVRATADDVETADQDAARQQLNDLADRQDARVAELEAQFEVESGLPRRKLARELQTAREFRTLVRGAREFTQIDDNADAAQAVDPLIESISEPNASPERDQAARQVIELMMRAPDVIGEEQLEALVDSPAFTAEQSQLIRSFSEANAAANALRSTEEVRQILTRGAAGFKGLVEYRSDVANALRVNDVPRAEREVEQLRNFYRSHSTKADMARQAQQEMESTGQAQYLYRDPNSDNGWSISRSRPWGGRVEQGELGGFAFNPRGRGPAAAQTFLTDLDSEVEAIVTTGQAMAAAVAMTGSNTVVNSEEGFVESEASDAELESVSQEAEVQSQPERELVIEEDAREEVEVPEREDTPAAEAVESQPELQESQPEADIQDPSQSETAEETVRSEDLDQALVEALAQTKEIEVEPGNLSIFAREQGPIDETADAARQYRSQNLVQRYFNQREPGESATTGNPLVLIQDFLTAARENTDLLQAVVADTVTEQEGNLFGLFSYFATNSERGLSSLEMLRESISQAKVNPGFRDRDLVQYFRDDLDENFLAALAVSGFIWLTENGGTTFNDDTAIRKILGEDETYEVQPEERSLLQLAGNRQNLVIQELGQKARQALELRDSEDAPANLQTQLELSLGTHILKMLERQGLVQINSISDSILDRGEGSNAHPFVRPSLNEDGDVIPPIRGILDAASGTRGFLNRVFSVEQGLLGPELEAKPFTQDTAQNTNQPIPRVLRQILERVSGREHVVRQDMRRVRNALSPEAVRAIAGYVDMHQIWRHPVNIDRQRAKNDAIERELERLNEFEASQGEAPFYFTPNVWSQFRVGLKQNLVNPQTSKLQRHNVSMAAWRTEVDPNEASEVRERFLLAVAQGMGIDVDKQLNVDSLAQLESLISDPVFRAGVEAIQAINLLEDGQQLSPQQQVDVYRAVELGGEAMHSLDALVNYARFEEGQPFTTELMFEVDGITNGPALAGVLLGTMNDGLSGMVGMYGQSSTFQHYTDYRQGHQPDLYERMVVAVHERLQQATEDQTALALIQTIMGPFVADDGKMKNGRKRVKTPLTSMIFGASPRKATKAMADEFIELFYEKVEQAVNDNDPDTLVALTEAATRLSGTRLDTLSLSNGMEAPNLTKGDITNIKQVFDGVIGEQVREVLQQDFGEFLQIRTDMNNLAQASWARYNAAFNHLRDRKLQELIASGEMPTGKTGKPIRDLTRTELAEIEQELAPMAPVVHTMLSKLSNQPEAGIDVSKLQRVIAAPGDTLYEADVSIGGQKSKIRPRGLKQISTDPGVRAVIMMVHSLDSAIASYSYNDVQALNIHDALGLSLTKTVAGAEALNRNTYSMLANYSIGLELLATLDRSFEAQQSLVVAHPELADVLNQVTIGRGESTQLVDQDFREALAHQAYSAEIHKLGFLENLKTVDQYALEGGSYSVTEEARTAVSQLRSRIFQAYATRFGEQEVQAAPEPTPQPTAPEETPFGVVGLPIIDSDPELVKLVSGEPKLRDVIPGLAARIKTTAPSPAQRNFQLGLLRMIGRSANPATQIRYIQPSTPSDGRTRSSALAWYTLDAQGEQINIKSPDFVNSGITTETLLHEMTHAAVAYTIARVEQGQFAEDSDEAQAYRGLQRLLEQARAYVDTNSIEGMSNAVTNVQELVAWGMTNERFQREVLSQIPFNPGDQAAAQQRADRSGFAAFIDFLADLIGLGKQDLIHTGLGSLVLNTGVMFRNFDQRAEPANQIDLNMAIPDSRQFTPSQVFDALGNANGGRVLDSNYSNYLKGTLDTVVGAVFSNGAIRAEALRQAPSTADDVFFNALSEGQAPFASASMGILPLTAQQAYVLESVEVAVNEAIDNSVLVRRELLDLYRQAERELSAADFHEGDWLQATPEEQAKAQTIYDFLFTIKGEGDGTSRFLSRFVAAGVAYQGLHNALQQIQVPADLRSAREGTLAERLTVLFERLMTFLQRRFTRVYEGQPAIAATDMLIRQLARIEQRKKASLGRSQDSVENVLARSVRDANEAIRGGVDRLGRSNFFRQSRFGIVRLTGAATSTIAGDRVDAVMDTIKRLRDGAVDGREGLLGSLATEFKGENEGNTQFHQLLAWANSHEQNRKRLMMDTAAAIRDEFSVDLTREQETALTRIALRTDLRVLRDHYNLSQIEALLANPENLSQAIALFESGLTGEYAQYYRVQAKALGYHLATGNVAINNLMLNAHNIAFMGNTRYQGQVDQAAAETALPIIDALTTLYALQYSSSEQKQLVADLMRKEANREDGRNAMDMVLRLYDQLQRDAAEQLFDNDPVQMLKGYTKDTFNPHIAIQAATAHEGVQLDMAGYTPIVGELARDPSDPTAQPKGLYMIRDGGLTETISGFMSLTSRRMRGSQIHGDRVDPVSGELNHRNTRLNSKVRAEVDGQVETLMNAPSNWDPRKADQQSHMVPVLNRHGEAVNFRYLMKEATKDDLLERDNRVTTVMGHIAGAAFDKAQSPTLNQAGVDAIRNDYLENAVREPDAYIEFGPNSADPVIAERYRLLPDDTKRYIRQVWGREGMKIRNDMYNVAFGYRKYSLREIFDEDPSSRNWAEFLFAGLMETFFGKKAALRVTQAENFWQETVRVVKDIWVIKNLFTLLGNESSNLFLLKLAGVPIQEIIRNKITAYRATFEYVQARREHDQLQQQVSAGYIGGRTLPQIESRIRELEDTMARSPVSDLVEAGMFQTLVEDIGSEENEFSYKSKLNRWVNLQTEWVPGSIKSVGKTLLMTHDTPLYQVMNRATVFSDFTARYVLHEYYTKRTDNPLSSEESLRRTREAFVNYDVPTHKAIQYLNDTGVVWFTKYYVRIQKVIFQLIRENPLNALGIWAIGDWLFNLPDILDSSILQKTPGNLGVGALELPGAVDEIITLRAATAPF